MSKWKLNDCPTCEGKKSKSAMTCMKCFRSGIGKRKAYGKSPRYDTETINKLREVVNKAREEQKRGTIR